jgi:hypothetical protein
MSSYSIPSINSSYSEVTMRNGVKGIIVLHHLEYGHTFHTLSHCDLTVWSIYWIDGVWWHLSYFFSLWPHCMQYFLRWWSTMIPFTPFRIVTSLYELFIEGMEYDDIVHIKWEKVWKVSSYFIPSMNTSYNEVTMRKGVKGVIVLHPLNKYFIQWGHKQRYEKYDDTFHTFSHSDLIIWSIYWGDEVRSHLSPLFSLWPHCMKYLLNIVLHPLNKYFIEWGHKQRCER